MHYTFGMSGHSKWSNIKHRKAAQDTKKNKVFSKISKLIIVAARGSNSGTATAEDLYNAPVGSIALAVEKAKAANMPKHNVIKALEKGLGIDEGANLVDITYEGYGPEGVAFLLESVTDNTNRTVSEIRNIFSKFGGSLGEAGSAAYMFNDAGDPTYKIPIVNKDKISELIEVLDDHEDIQKVFHNADI